MARKGKLINYIKRLTGVSWHRDNGRDNNFFTRAYEVCQGCCFAESRMLAQGAGLQTQNATRKSRTLGNGGSC